MKDAIFVVILISLGIKFFLLWTRKKEWNTNVFRLILTGPLFLAGLIGVFFLNSSNDPEIQFIWWCCITPLIATGIDRLFKFLSIKIQQRDFYLWLKFSDDLGYGLFGLKPHFTGLDVLFSLIVILSSIIIILIAMP